MFCPKCGEILRDTALRCPVCGASQRKNQSQVNDPCDCDTNKGLRFRWDKTNTHSTYASHTSYNHKTGSSRPRGQEFGQIIGDFFRRGLDFRGRTPRRAYWWTRLFIILVSLLAAMSDTLSIVWFLVLPLPYIALNTRRLHDIGKSGWWQMLKMIPIAGELILDIWCCLPSAPPNRWGRRP